MNILLIFLLARLTLHLPLHGEQQKHTCSTDLDNYTEQYHSWNKLSPKTISNHVTEHTRTQPSENPAKKLRPNSAKTNGAIEMLHCSPKLCITIQQQPIAPESSLCATPHTTHPPPPPPPLAQGGITFKFKCPHSSIHLSLWGSVVCQLHLLNAGYLSLAAVRVWFKLWHFSGCRVTDCP